MKPAKTTTIAPQSEEDTKKGQGRAALRLDPLNPINPLSNSKVMAQDRKKFVSSVWRGISCGGNRKRPPNSPNYQINTISGPGDTKTSQPVILITKA